MNCLEVCPPGTAQVVRVVTNNTVSATGSFRSRSRRRAIISAVDSENVNADGVPLSLRCDVWVAPLHTLDISTVVERLAVNASEQVAITAKDEFDNTFSLLEVRLPLAKRRRLRASSGREGCALLYCAGPRV